MMKIMPNDQDFFFPLANRELSYKSVAQLNNCIEFMVSIMAFWFSP